MRQGPTESTKDFTQRIEKVYYELTHTQTVGKTTAESKIMAQTVQAYG